MTEAAASTPSEWAAGQLAEIRSHLAALSHAHGAAMVARLCELAEGVEYEISGQECRARAERESLIRRLDDAQEHITDLALQREIHIDHLT